MRERVKGLKAKIFKRMYEVNLKWNFQKGGWGLEPKKLSSMAPIG